MAGDWKRLAVSWSAPLDGHHVDALHTNATKLSQFRPTPFGACAVKPRATHDPTMELSRPSKIVSADFGLQGDGGRSTCRSRAGRTIVRILPNERSLPSEHPPSKEHPNGTPVPDSKPERPPIVRREEVIAIALTGLLIIAATAALYAAKAFFLPVVMAFVVGTMLAPAAAFLERYKIPRPIGAVLIVLTVGAVAAFIVGLIGSPMVEWSGRLPELGARLKEKLHVFDPALVLWQQLQGMLGGSDPLARLQLPKFEWVQPTLEFLSPTFTEFLLFFVTLVLFIASWRDLRRSLILTFGDHASRLRTLRILNEIEDHLGGYLLTVSTINIAV